MARNLHIKPTFMIEGSTWTLLLMIFDQDTRVTETLTFSVAAGVTAETPLRLLKWGADIITSPPETNQDVLDAFTVDDIQPGGQTKTVLETWIETAEPIIAGLTTGYDEASFWAAWGPNDTAALRNAARNAIFDGPGPIGRGWETPWLYQHEGDGTHQDFAF